MLIIIVISSVIFSIFSLLIFQKSRKTEQLRIAFSFLQAVNELKTKGERYTPGQISTVSIAIAILGLTIAKMSGSIFVIALLFGLSIYFFGRTLVKLEKEFLAEAKPKFSTLYDHLVLLQKYRRLVRRKMNKDISEIEQMIKEISPELYPQRTEKMSLEPLKLKEEEQK
jgi:hypothetical protein